MSDIVGLNRPLPTPREDLDSFVAELSDNSQEWVNLAVEEKINIVEEIIAKFPKVWDRWSNFSMLAKGISDRKTGNDRDWMELANIARVHTVVLRSLKEIQK